MIINKLIRHTTEPVRFKAPTRKMYKIYSIHFSVFSAGRNDVLVSAKSIEDVAGNLPNTEGGRIAIMACDIVGTNFEVNFSVLPVETKYITLGHITSATMACQVVINYDLFTPSIADLIWEFISRGKNP